MERLKRTLKVLGICGLWITLAALAALVAYQVYGTLLYVGLSVVQTPDLRPPGWNTATIYGLGRFLVLVLGICWLLTVSFLVGYLREGVELRRLWRRVAGSLLIGGVIYGLSAGALWMLQGE